MTTLELTPKRANDAKSSSTSHLSMILIAFIVLMTDGVETSISVTLTVLLTSDFIILSASVSLASVGGVQPILAPSDGAVILMSEAAADKCCGLNQKFVLYT